MTATRLAAVLAVFFVMTSATALSRAPKHAYTVDQIISNTRAAIAPSGALPNTFATGSGEAMGMDLTLQVRYDADGRFVFSGRGHFMLGMGYDGNEVWRQGPSGDTRVLSPSETYDVLVPQWLITGFWVTSASPLILKESKEDVDKDEAALTIGMKGSPLEGTLIIDAKRWLPKTFTINDGGADHVIVFDEWMQSGGRYVPRKLHTESGGKETGRFLLDGYRPDDDIAEDTYTPPADRIDLAFDTNVSARVEARRGRWGHHFVEPLVNGEKVGWFTVDTGAGMTHIDKEVFDKLDLEVVGETKSTGIGGMVEEKVTIIESIEIGPLTIRNLPVIVSDIDALSLGIPDERGLLGMDFMRHCVMEYDQKNSTIALYNPTSYELPHGDWKRLLSHNGKPLVAMPYEGRDGLFTIDTGNPGAVIVSPHTVEKYDLLEGRSTTSGTLGGIGGRVAVEKGTFEWVEWGDKHFKDVPADFIVKNQGAGAVRSRDGIIGTDLLRRYLVVFDMQHGRIAYLPN